MRHVFQPYGVIMNLNFLVLVRNASSPPVRPGTKQNDKTIKPALRSTFLIASSAISANTVREADIEPNIEMLSLGIKGILAFVKHAHIKCVTSPAQAP